MPSDGVNGRSGRFVKLLMDFGHLDDSAADRVAVGATEMQECPGHANLAAARRAAAIVLFDEVAVGEPKGLLNEDWVVLFS